MKYKGNGTYRRCSHLQCWKLALCAYMHMHACRKSGAVKMWQVWCEDAQCSALAMITLPSSPMTGGPQEHSDTYGTHASKRSQCRQSATTAATTQRACKHAAVNTASGTWRTPLSCHEGKV